MVECPFLNATCRGPMKVSNSGLHALNIDDVIIFLSVHRRLTGRKDEHIPCGFPVLKSGTMMEVVKSSGVIIVLSIRLNSISRHLCRFSLPNLYSSLGMPQMPTALPLYCDFTAFWTWSMSSLKLQFSCSWDMALGLAVGGVYASAKCLRNAAALVVSSAINTPSAERSSFFCAPLRICAKHFNAG